MRPYDVIFTFFNVIRFLTLFKAIKVFRKMEDVAMVLSLDEIQVNTW